MYLCEFPTLEVPAKTWLPQLQAGNPLVLRAALQKASEPDIFKLGMACAERDLLAGVQEAIAALLDQQLEGLFDAMARHWLEASILLENNKITYYLRALPINPMAAPAAKESFAGATFHGRRTSRIDAHLKSIDEWPAELVEQFKTTRLLSSLLFRAIHHQPFECVEKLLELGADPNVVAEGYHPLWAATRAGKPGVINALLARGASLEVAGHHAGKSLLVFAAARGQQDCAWALVEAGASVSDQSCGLDAPTAARTAGHVKLASDMEAHALALSPKASSAGNSSRRL